MRLLLEIVIWVVKLAYLFLIAVFGTIIRLFSNKSENVDRGKTYVRAYYFLELLDNGGADTIEQANSLASYLLHPRSDPDINNNIIRRAMAHNQEYGGIQLTTIEAARTKGFTG